jgi:hypothetical protein
VKCPEWPQNEILHVCHLTCRNGINQVFLRQVFKLSTVEAKLIAPTTTNQRRGKQEWEMWGHALLFVMEEGRQGFFPLDVTPAPCLDVTPAPCLDVTPLIYIKG